MPSLKDEFDERGFVRIDGAFSRTQAEAALELLWRDTGLDRDDPSSWTKPVVRLGMYPQLSGLANTPKLHAAFDELVGAGRWLPTRAVGTVVARFPSDQPPGDDGWHIDASFPGKDPNDYFQWRINSQSRGRLLLMLFLFTDVGVDDGPTRIRVGSHRTIEALLKPHGEDGLSFMEVAQRIDVTKDAPEALAVGDAGTVYLCHPFLAHAGQAHHGKTPRFLAQPPLFPKP